MIETYPMLVIEDPVEGGYTVSIPDLPGCITCCQRWEDIPEPTDINKVEV